MVSISADYLGDGFDLGQDAAQRGDVFRFERHLVANVLEAESVIFGQAHS